MPKHLMTLYTEQIQQPELIDKIMLEHVQIWK